MSGLFRCRKLAIHFGTSVANAIDDVLSRYADNAFFARLAKIDVGDQYGFLRC